MSQNGKLMPQLDQQSTKVLNLTVLQRIDPYVEEILTTAAHVTFYEFNVELSQWSRKDVEGSLFVVKRKTQPRFQFIVMNRRNTENLVEDLLGDFEYEVQVPYLLYRNAAQEVNGIWFYNPRECEEIASLFNRILSAFAKVPPKPKAFTPKSTEFQELERVPTSAIMEGPLEPTESAPSTSAEVSEEPFEHFFGGALHLNNLSNMTSSAPMKLSAVTHTLPSRSLSSSSPTPPPMPIPSPPLPLPSLPVGSMDGSEAGTSRHNAPVKPYLFVPPPSSTTLMPPPIFSKPTAPPLQPPSHGAPLLQPFPPPAPPLSLAPASSMSHGPVITRDGIRGALLKLVQNEHFIDMVYREMMNAHLS
uniref:WH1 domain-containing protein n=1 Tax=Araucaria cunninghamii TaxID=56994 RepID=A0A0D6R9X9_ARACU